MYRHFEIVVYFFKGEKINRLLGSVGLYSFKHIYMWLSTQKFTSYMFPKGVLVSKTKFSACSCFLLQQSNLATHTHTHKHTHTTHIYIYIHRSASAAEPTVTDNTACHIDTFHKLYFQAYPLVGSRARVFLGENWFGKANLGKSRFGKACLFLTRFGKAFGNTRFGKAW